MPATPRIKKARVKFPDAAPCEFRLGVAITRNKKDSEPSTRIDTDLPSLDGWLVLGKIRIVPRFRGGISKLAACCNTVTA